MNIKNLVLTITLLSLSLSGFSQALTFCDRADVTGKAINAGTTFTIAKNGGPVTLLFSLPSAAKLSTVNFDLYKLENGKEIFQSTMKQPVDASREWVAKQITLYNEGRYRVYVFDDQDKQLAKGELTIRK